MSRPATLKVGNTSYWTIMTYTSAGVLVDADSTPTVVVYKNGSLTADVVTVTKRSATTGIYDAYYNPASEAEGDCFTIQETATISSQAYVQSWNFEILAAERGTDNASTFDAASDAVTTDAASRTASQADVSALATAASIAALNNFDPTSDTVANVTTVASVTAAVTTDAASRTASQADVSALATSASIAALNDFDPATQTVTTDAASRTASQADVSALATAASITALNDLDAAGIRTAVGLASANLDTQLGTIDTVADAVQVKTDQLTFTNANSVDATASVNVDTSAIANAVIAGIGGTEVTISSMVATDGTTITIVQGDDYNSSESRQITWTGLTSNQWPSLSGATLSLTASNRLNSLTVVPTVTSPTGTQAFQLELTADQTNIGSGRYQYDVQATLASGRVVTLLSGEMIVKKSHTD
ncbi:MAG: hypothetical protein GY878_18415 [Fuerstiella sp.]|nr:hypothetical protein [Fuerstiella sp.]